MKKKTIMDGVGHFLLNCVQDNFPHLVNPGSRMHCQLPQQVSQENTYEGYYKAVFAHPSQAGLPKCETWGRKHIWAAKISTLLVTMIFILSSFILEAANAPVTTAATILNALPSQQVTVPVTVTGFNNIGSFTLTLDYEYAKLQYVSGNANPDISGSASIGDNDMGNGYHRLVINWYGSGASLSDGSWLVNYVFNYTSGPAALQWFDNGPSCGYRDATASSLIDTPTSSFYINGLVTSPTGVNTKVFLEGPYSGTFMSTSLRTNGLLPLTQPYSGSPWNYSGTESVASIPANVTDWILVELRTGTAASTKVATRAGFLKNDGVITDLNGTGTLSFAGVSAGNYYVVIRHRNHMPIMSSAAVPLNASSVLYDFSSGSAKAYGGTNGCKLINSSLSLWGMASADASNDGSIFTNDYTAYWVPFFGTTNTYNRADFNLDGSVFTNDYTNNWVPNFGKSNVLP